MITLFDKKQDCCGCTACKNICPQQAITMKSDEEGFLYPIIDDVLCIECGLCKTVCPFQNEVTIQGHFAEPAVYAIKHGSDSVRMSSSSGGVYTAISDHVLENKSGICYGVKFDKDFTVRHTGATTADERDKLRGSKYVQSDLGTVFYEAKQNLSEGKLVLFTGTPCQTAGLAKFLEVSKIDISNLILNDIICHGTPSPKLWNDYVMFVEEKNKSKLQDYTFRFKEKGWRGYNVKAGFESGRYELNTKDILKYIKLFNSNLALRPSCYYCKFANLHRPSDIMIGDFWGIEKSMPEFEDERGVSLVFINTKQGEAVFEQIKNDIYFKQGNTTDCMQLNLQQPTKKPANREKFWKDYYNRGFMYIAKRYAGDGFTGRMRSFSINMLRRIGLLSMIKKVLSRS
jgi:coenzyme F420-reducing hydrogenase beta subunit